MKNKIKDFPIIIGSSNQNKIKEIKNFFGTNNVKSIADFGITEDVIEDGLYFDDNAEKKAHAYMFLLRQKLDKFIVLADDSGLCVNSLNGDPGVFSARYAGEHDDTANNEKLLEELKYVDDRSAYFITVVKGYVYNHGSLRSVIGVGITTGTILEEPRGSNGFAYDPLFLSDELGKTFGEATIEEKNSISHRIKAFKEIKLQL